MLSQAGVTDTYSQLQINVALNVWCLACAGAGTLLADKIRRKPLATGSLTFALIFLYLVGALTKRELVRRSFSKLANLPMQCMVLPPTNLRYMALLHASSWSKVGGPNKKLPLYTNRLQVVTASDGLHYLCIRRKC
jgi:hypothetical protein